MIRIADPSNLGQALRDIRNVLGYNRRELASAIAEATGRGLPGVYSQLREWDHGVHSPTAKHLGPVLDALGYDLALVPRDADAPSALRSPPQSDENGSVVGRLGVDDPNGSEARCDCGHDGLDPMFHLRPCPIAEQRIADRKTARTEEQP